MPAASQRRDQATDLALSDNANYRAMIAQAQFFAAQLPAHLRDRTYFSLEPHLIMLSQPFDLDDATNDRLTYFIRPLSSFPDHTTFSHAVAPSGEFLANVAQQLGMLTYNTLLDWGLLHGLLRAVGRRLRSEDLTGQAPAWYNASDTKRVISAAADIVKGGLDLSVADRYRLPPALQPHRSLAGPALSTHDDDGVPGGYAPMPPYLMKELGRALGRFPSTPMPSTIGSALGMLGGDTDVRGSAWQSTHWAG